MRLASLAVLALFSSVALVGCGDDGGDIAISKDKATTTAADGDGGDGTPAPAGGDREALIVYVTGADHSFADQKSGECVADEALDDLSEDAIATVNEGGDFDLTNFDSKDVKVLVAALDKCIELSDALESFAAGITSEASLPITDDEAKCAAKEFSKEYDGAGEFIEAVGAMSDDESGSKLFEALGPCLTDESAVAFMGSVLADQGLGEELGTCIAQGIVDELGAEGMLKAINEVNSGSSTELQDASAKAAGACAASGVGGADPSATIPPIGGGLSG